MPCPKIVRGQELLTPEQEAYARQFAQERIAAVLSCAAIDEQEAEAHLRAAYRVAGLEPVPVRWFESPVAFCLASLQEDMGVSVHQAHLRGNVWWPTFQRVSASMRGSVGTSLLANVRNSVGTGLPASMTDGMEDDVDTSVWDSVWERVGASLYASVADSVWERVGNSLGVSRGPIEFRGGGDNAEAIVRHHLMTNVHAGVQAYYNEHGNSFYRFFHEIFEENDRIHEALLNEMVSGYHLGNQEAWLVHKPIRLERDEQGRLHSADGMCMQYRDGWGFYAWHGVRCSEKLILHPEQVTKEEWLQESNLEIRRVIQERLGAARFVELIGGTCLDHGTRGDLLEIDLGDDPERVARYVHVKDPSTERRYYLRVPPTIQGADEGVAWSFGLEVTDYQPLQET